MPFYHKSNFETRLNNEASNIQGKPNFQFFLSARTENASMRTTMFTYPGKKLIGFCLLMNAGSISRCFMTKVVIRITFMYDKAHKI